MPSPWHEHPEDCVCVPVCVGAASFVASALDEASFSWWRRPSSPDEPIRTGSAGSRTTLRGTRTSTRRGAGWPTTLRAPPARSTSPVRVPGHRCRTASASRSGWSEHRSMPKRTIPPRSPVTPNRRCPARRSGSDRSRSRHRSASPRRDRWPAGRSCSPRRSPGRPARSSPAGARLHLRPGLRHRCGVRCRRGRLRLVLLSNAAVVAGRGDPDRIVLVRGTDLRCRGEADTELSDLTRLSDRLHGRTCRATAAGARLCPGPRLRHRCGVRRRRG